MNIIQNTRYGHMIFNDRDIYQGKSFLHYGEYSEGEVELFRRLLSPDDIVVEVGANIGSLTVPLAQLVPKGLVLAFEPERNNFYTLCGNIASNNLTNVRCLQRAVSNQAGFIKVPEIDVENTDNFGAIELDKDYEGYATYGVETVALDHVVIPHCRLIKIDVEGMERIVLESGTNLIQKYRPFLYVENDRPDRSEALMTLIHLLGYEMYYHCPYMFNPDNFFGNTENVMGNVASINLLCVPSEKKEREFMDNLGLRFIEVKRKEST